MEIITLQPGMWTRIFSADQLQFQSRSNQSGIRSHLGMEEPAVDTELYFVTQEFDLKPAKLDSRMLNVYMMPHEDHAVDVVTF